MNEQRTILERVSDLVPLAWLALALTAYWFVAAAPMDRPEQLTAPVPGLAEADRAAGPLLAALLVVGIIRYFGLWHPFRRTPLRRRSKAEGVHELR